MQSAQHSSRSVYTDINQCSGVEVQEDIIHLSQAQGMDRQGNRGNPGAGGVKGSMASRLRPWQCSRYTDCVIQGSMFSKRSSKRSNQSRGSNGGVDVPLRDRTNATSTASSSFLPELNSTPPMPTFQKPVERYPSVPKRARPASGNWAELADVSNLLDTPGQHHVVVGYGAYDRPPFDTPELPKVWTSQHDRAICVLDSRNFDLPSIVRKMREVFPALTTYILTQSMVDKRLRQLDQDVYIDYWRVGLRASEASQPSHPLMTAHRQPGMGSSATLTGPTLMPPFEENKPVKEPKVKVSRVTKDSSSRDQANLPAEEVFPLVPGSEDEGELHTRSTKSDTCTDKTTGAALEPCLGQDIHGQSSPGQHQQLSSRAPR